ncbi:hypothetical protein [Rubripirellula reticaptiva]|uniref:Uncharacterized protein n=1 Tax=Rubripirellula reticaptiva TaxID=2528013 RepID=A0A5C6EJR7_9BACT|nr:hypothetical protein [Rubripirellula reticaptiva]TWU49292.1 hypothetical protein Poly59_39060 [Rubripirellula reticaptiva]
MDDLLDQFMEDHINGGYGEILDEQAVEEYPADEPWDETLAQQELEDFEQADEHFGYYGGEDW